MGVSSYRSDKVQAEYDDSCFFVLQNNRKRGNTKTDGQGMRNKGESVTHIGGDLSTMDNDRATQNVTQ